MISERSPPHCTLSPCTFDRTRSPDYMLMITRKQGPRSKTSYPPSCDARRSCKSVGEMLTVAFTVRNEAVCGRSLRLAGNRRMLLTSFHTCQLFACCDGFFATAVFVFAPLTGHLCRRCGGGGGGGIQLSQCVEPPRESILPGLTH